MKDCSLGHRTELIPSGKLVASLRKCMSKRAENATLAMEKGTKE